MKILIIEPYFFTAYHFRKELILKLATMSKLTLVIDHDENAFFSNQGIDVVEIPCDLRSLSVFKNVNLLWKYKKVIHQIKPSYILSFAIKPNIFCGLVKPKNCYLITNITGLGRSFSKEGILNRLAVFLYRFSFKKSDFVFFQNQDICDFFFKKRIPVKSYCLIPGSGVNTNYFIQNGFLKRRGNFERCFLFPARITELKGINTYLEAARRIKAQYPYVTFFVAGQLDNDYKDKIYFFEKIGIIKYLGFVNDLRDLYKKVDCIVLPTYYKEGMSNVLLEAISCGRIIICSNDVSGSKEIVVDGKNGFGIPANSVDLLCNAIAKVINLSDEKLAEMGSFARSFAKQYFDRSIVIHEYLKVIFNVNGKEKIG